MDELKEILKEHGICEEHSNCGTDCGDKPFEDIDRKELIEELQTLKKKWEREAVEGFGRYIRELSGFIGGEEWDDAVTEQYLTKTKEQEGEK